MRRELARLARRLRPTPHQVHWRGVYARAADVPVDGPGFAGDTWLEMTRAMTIGLRDRAQTRPWTVPRADIQMLATLVATGDKPRILDFGGGMGIAAIALRAATSARFELHVVEGPRVCELGRAIVDDVTFHEALPEQPARFEIVYAASSLQYIDDHRSLFEALARYQPRYMLFGDVPAGDVETFWTAQHTVPGSRIAYKFMNLAKLVETMGSLDYQLLVRGVAERPLDVESLPSSHRLERTCNLLFSR